MTRRMLKQIRQSSRRTRRVALLSVKNMKLGFNIWIVQSEFWINNMKAWIQWCSGVGDVFLVYSVPLSANWELFKSRRLSCCWPCLSLYSHSVSIFWCILLAFQVKTSQTRPLIKCPFSVYYYKQFNIKQNMELRYWVSELNETIFLVVSLITLYGITLSDMTAIKTENGKSYFSAHSWG